MSFIENLQNKPRHIRIKILWASVIFVMVIVFFVWLFVLQSSLDLSFDSETEQAQLVEQEQNIPSIFRILKEDFSMLKSNLKATVKKIISDNEEVAFEVEIIKPRRLPE